MDVVASLQAWPKVEGEERDYAKAVLSRIEGRIESEASNANATEETEDLFAAPLPEEEGEGRDRDRKKLQAIAEMARAKSKDTPRARDEDSGIIHLASVMGEKGETNAATAAVAAPLNEEKTAARAVATPVASAALPKRGIQSQTVIALFVGFAAAAAGFMMLTKTQAPAPSALRSPVEAVADPQPAVKAPPTTAATAPEAPAVSPNALPSVSVASQPTAAGKPGAMAGLAKDDATPAAAPTAPPVATTTTPDDLATALKKEMGDRELRPAASESGGKRDLPAQPSQGSVMGALGAVLPEARACLGPDDAISHASVVFGSDGNVRSVTITGGGTGKPAETCLKAAFMRAKVQPFSDATSASSITVRHL